MNTADRRIAEVERYIHELAIALSGLPADEREDVIAGIREHIDDSLLTVADPTPADVQRVLDDLGDPLAIAADAGAPAPPPPAAPSAARERPEIPLLQRDWIPLAMIGSFALAGLLVLAYGRITVLALGLWLLGLVILLASALWRTFEKLVGGATFVLVPPAVLVIGWRYGPWPDRVSDMFGHRFDRVLFPPTLGIQEPLDSMLIVGLGLVVLVAVGAWLVHRGSARTRRRGSSRVAHPTGD